MSCSRPCRRSSSYGPEELRRTAQELEARGAHTEFALAKRLVRLGKYLALTGTVYRPKALMDPDTPQATLAAHYQSLWEKLLPKWRDKADLREVFAPEQPLGQWRKMVQELYALELRLPQQKAAHEVQRVSSIKVRRRRGGANGIGTGPAWLVYPKAIAVLGNQHCRFQGGIPAGRLLSVSMQAPTGDLAGSCSKILPSGSLGLSGPIPAQTPIVMSVHRLAVGSQPSCHHRPLALFLSRP